MATPAAGRARFLSEADAGADGDLLADGLPPPKAARAEMHGGTHWQPPQTIERGRSGHSLVDDEHETLGGWAPGERSGQEAERACAAQDFAQLIAVRVPGPAAGNVCADGDVLSSVRCAGGLWCMQLQTHRHVRVSGACTACAWAQVRTHAALCASASACA